MQYISYIKVYVPNVKEHLKIKEKRTNPIEKCTKDMYTVSNNWYSNDPISDIQMILKQRYPQLHY